MTACELVISDIVHVRHAVPDHLAKTEGSGHRVAHTLNRKGMSLWIDLDRIEEADQQSALFSVGRFNLLSFHEKDYGPNFEARRMVMPLAQYAREIAQDVLPDITIASVKLLTFPRILGAAFNPISVYLLNDGAKDVAVIYEVRNTFGDMHSYVGVVSSQDGQVHQAEKRLHVSPFFSMDGGYRLKLRDSDDGLSLVINYHDNETPLLTATLRGMKHALNTANIIKGFMRTRVFPMRPLLSIHVEALKLWLKRVQFFARPEPDPRSWTLAKTNTIPKEKHHD